VVDRPGCCESVRLEGTATLTESPRSARILWNHQSTSVRGGGPPPRSVPMPGELQGEVVGALGRLQLHVQGGGIAVFVNGEPVADFPQAVFRRGSVLRVNLVGRQDDASAVYLADYTCTLRGYAVPRPEGREDRTSTSKGGMSSGCQECTGPRTSTSRRPPSRSPEASVGTWRPPGEGPEAAALRYPASHHSNQRGSGGRDQLTQG
jgi:hypothetical protein